MKAMVLREFGKALQLEHWPDPECGPADVVLEVRACGLCGTDLKIVAGDVPSVRLPHVPGHEVAGVVAEAGRDVKGLRPGDRACAHFYVPCLACEPCRAGRPNLCLEMPAGRIAGRLGFEWPGAFAERVRVPARALVRLPPDTPLDELCVCADAVATPYHALHTRLGVTAGQRLVLLGAGGGLGLHAVQIARAAGARVVAVDRGGNRIEHARALGADEGVDTAIPGQWEALLARGRFADAVIDMAGAAEIAAQATGCVKPGGHQVIVGYRYGERLPIPYQPAVSFELTFLGSRASTQSDLEAAVALVLAGKVRPVVAARVPLEQANQALESLRTAHLSGRTVLVP